MYMYYHLHTCITPAEVGTLYQGWGEVQLTKYSSTPSTPNIYKYWSSTHFLKKYLSTLSIFISSTSTHIKICSKIKMDIQSKVNLDGQNRRAFPKSCLCSKVKMAIFYAE